MQCSTRLVHLKQNMNEGALRKSCRHCRKRKIKCVVLQITATATGCENRRCEACIGRKEECVFEKQLPMGRPPAGRKRTPSQASLDEAGPALRPRPRAVSSAASTSPAVQAARRQIRSRSSSVAGGFRPQARPFIRACVGIYAEERDPTSFQIETALQQADMNRLCLSSMIRPQLQPQNDLRMPRDTHLDLPPMRANTPPEQNGFRQLFDQASCLGLAFRLSQARCTQDLVQLMHGKQIGTILHVMFAMLVEKKALAFRIPYLREFRRLSLIAASQSSHTDKYTAASWASGPWQLKRFSATLVQALVGQSLGFFAQTDSLADSEPRFVEQRSGFNPVADLSQIEQLALFFGWHCTSPIAFLVHDTWFIHSLQAQGTDEAALSAHIGFSALFQAEYTEEQLKGRGGPRHEARVYLRHTQDCISLRTFAKSQPDSLDSYCLVALGLDALVHGRFRTSFVLFLTCRLLSQQDITRLERIEMRSPLENVQLQQAVDTLMLASVWLLSVCIRCGMPARFSIALLEIAPLPDVNIDKCHSLAYSDRYSDGPAQSPGLHRRFTVFAGIVQVYHFIRSVVSSGRPFSDLSAIRFVCIDTTTQDVLALLGRHRQRLTSRPLRSP